MKFVIIQQGQKLMMMGTADEIVKAPEKGPVFMEDLPEEEQVVAVVRLYLIIYNYKDHAVFYDALGIVWGF